MDVIKIKKGLTINLAGAAEPLFSEVNEAKFYGIKPSDYVGLTPKLRVKVGDTVKVGTTLFVDKQNQDTCFVSPVSGVVKEVRRGERRKVLAVIVESDGQYEHEQFEPLDLEQVSREELIKDLQKTGLWNMLTERPYGVIANPEHDPKAIYLSCFDTAPLSIDYDPVLLGREDAFKTGLEVLKKLTQGYVHIGLEHGRVSKVFESLRGVRKTYFSGPHPAGNVGTQLAQCDPINKGEVVWTIKLQDVIAFGERFLKHRYDAATVVAIAGSEVIRPSYIRTRRGASITPLLENNLKKEEKLRIISGNVLSGTQVGEDDFLGAFDIQVCVIPEGDSHNFLGWITPNFNKMTVHRTSPSFFIRKKEYRLDANMNGGERAMIFSGEYDKVLPMDILPEFLFKAIIVNDIDKMEQLGIYEVLPEDVALCEFVCTSKIPLQQILRDGLDMMRKEMG